MIELAIRHAKKNPIIQRGRSSIGRFGVVLTNGRRTFRSWNSYKSHPLQAKYAQHPEQIHVHAEIAALAQMARRTSPKDWPEYTMYVARVFKDGTPALAAPCLGCQRAIIEFNIKHVEYTE